MRGWRLAGVVLACVAPVAACAARAAEPVWVAPPVVDTSHIDKLVERAPELAPRAVAPAAPRRVASSVTLPTPPVVLPLVRPRAGGDALALADLAMARRDPFDAAAQYRAILARRPAYAAYVEYRLAQAYVALGDSYAHRAIPHLRAAAPAPAPEGWAALILLAELRAARIGGVAALAELRALAGDRVLELEAHLVNVVPDDERGELLMQMAFDANAASPSSACDLAVTAVAAGYASDNPPALDRSCRDDVESALATAMGGMIAERTVTFEWHFNRAAYAWDELRERAHRGQYDASPWMNLARDYLVARAHAVEERHKDLASLGAQAALQVTITLLAHTRQTGDITPQRLRALAAELDPRFPVVLPHRLMRRLGERRPPEAP